MSLRDLYLIVRGIKIIKCVESFCIDHLVAAEQGQRHQDTLDLES